MAASPRWVVSPAGRSCWARRLGSAALAGMIVLGNGVARAEPGAPAEPRSPGRAAGPRGPKALLTGIAVAGSSLGLAGFMLASDSGLPVKHAGLAVLHGGLTFAPIAAHGVVDEWGRGAAFAIAPALGSAGMAALVASHPGAPVVGKNKSQRIYPLLVGVTAVGSAVGIFDAALVDERAAVAVGAAASNEFTGAWVRGRF